MSSPPANAAPAPAAPREQHTLAFEPVARADWPLIYEMGWQTLPPRIAAYSFAPEGAGRRVRLRSAISAQVARARGAAPIAEGSYWLSLDGQRCGWTSYSTEPPILHWPWVLILPQFQGKGVLGQVIERLVTEARRTGCTEIEGAVDTQNHHSIHALEKRGFELEGDPRHYFLVGRRTAPTARAARAVPFHAAAAALASFQAKLALPGGPRAVTFLGDGTVSLSLDGVRDAREADAIVGGVFDATLARRVRAACAAAEPPIPTGSELEGVVYRVVKRVSP
jgi:RimJ/RimL family protein N-acetyltransferase